MAKGSSNHAGQAEIRVEKINLSPFRKQAVSFVFSYLSELKWGGFDKNPTGGMLSDRYGAGGGNF